MPNVEHDIPHFLITPLGTLGLNHASGYRYLIQPDGYQIVPSMRVAHDDIAHDDGSIMHPRYKTGLVATMTVEYWATYDAEASSPSAGPDEAHFACGAERWIMHDELVAHLSEITRLSPTSPQQLVWTPTDAPHQRMLDDIQTLGWIDPKFEDNGLLVAVTFSVESPLPYALTVAETVTPVASGDTEYVVNEGSATVKPLIRVYGATSAFSVYNLDDLDDQGNVKGISYDASRPGALPIGGGQHADIDFAKGTILLGGVTDMIAGLDPTISDFFVLHSRSRQNRIVAAGANIDVIHHHGWA